MGFIFPLSFSQCITVLLHQFKIDEMLPWKVGLKQVFRRQHNYNASVLCLEQTLQAFTEVIDV